VTAHGGSHGLTPEAEREIIDTARLIRRVIYGVLILLGAGLLLSVVVGLASAFGGGTIQGRGTDIHAPLKAGATASLTTEAGAQAKVRILAVTEDATSIRILVRTTGLDPQAASPETWRMYLANNTRDPVLVEQQLETATQDPEFWLTWRRSSPSPEPLYLHFNPDSSRGDIYFDILP
jgi:hypothetical protein